MSAAQRAASHRQRMRSVYEQRRADGLCAACPAPPRKVSPGRGGLCDEHADEFAERAARSRSAGKRWAEIVDANQRADMDDFFLFTA